MHIRTASAAEMLALWGENPDHPSPTARFNCENIESGSATLFVWDRSGVLVGELYLPIRSMFSDRIFALAEWISLQIKIPSTDGSSG